jgi:hypothetical protein
MTNAHPQTTLISPRLNLLALLSWTKDVAVTLKLPKPRKNAKNPALKLKTLTLNLRLVLKNVRKLIWIRNLRNAKRERSVK